MKQFIIAVVVLFPVLAKAQELFVFTEPASNISAKTLGIRIEQMLMKDNYAIKNSYYLIPKIMYGLSRNVMVQGGMMLSNVQNGFYLNGGSVNVRYRFLSKEGIHNHFRMAAFGKYSVNNSHIHEYAIDFMMHNSGYETGVIATQLLKRLAVSVSGSFLHATDNTNGEKYLFGNKLRNAFNYSLSGGILVLPKEYTGYGQTNVNLMVELLGQTNLHNGFNFLDIAPSLQFIILSRMRVDLGYRLAMVKKLQRSASDGGLLRIEYNFYNVGH